MEQELAKVCVDEMIQNVLFALRCELTFCTLFIVLAVNGKDKAKTGKVGENRSNLSAKFSHFRLFLSGSDFEGKRLSCGLNIC